MADTEPKQLSFRFPESGEQIEFKFDDPSTKSLGEAVGSLKKVLEEGLGLEGNKDSFLKKLLKQSKKPKGDSPGNGEPTGPRSRGGAFMGSVGEDIKDTGKSILDTFTAPIRALPGAKSLGKAIGAARKFEPITPEDETQEKKEKESGGKGILGGHGAGTIVGELESGFSCICRNTELIRESLTRLIDAGRGDKLEAKERANERKKGGKGGILTKHKKVMEKPYQWAEEITSGVIGGTIASLGAAVLGVLTKGKIARLLGATPLVNKIPGVANMAANASRAKVAVQATRAADYASPAATTARNLKGAVNPLMRPTSGAGLGSRILHGTPSTTKGFGFGAKEVAGKKGLLGRLGLGGSKAQMASHAAQEASLAMGGGRRAGQALQLGKLGQAASQGSKVARTALMAKNFVKSTGIGTLAMAPVDIVSWWTNAAEAEAGGLEHMNSLNEVMKDSDGRLIDKFTGTVLIDPTLDMGGTTDEENASSMRLFRSYQEMAANETKINSLLDAALTSRTEEGGGLLGSDTGANQLMSAVDWFMKDREKIAARSGLADPKELQKLIAFKGQQEIDKKIADIRGTTSIWEQQDRGYVADIESSARDIESGAASGRAMEGPMGAKVRSDISKTRHMEQLAAADQAGGLSSLLTSIEQESGENLSGADVSEFLSVRNDISGKLKASLESDGIYGILTPAQENRITDMALEEVGLQRPTGIASINPTSGVVDRTIDSQNNLTNNTRNASDGDMGVGGNPPIVTAANSITNVVNNNTINRNTAMNEVAFTRAAIDSTRANMFA